MLQPEFDTKTEASELPASSGIEAIMAAAGITESKEEKAEREKGLTHVQKIFQNHGAGIDTAASKIAELMDSNKSEVALRACETALKVQGVFNDRDKVKQLPTVTINVHNSHGSEGKTLINLVMPTV